MKTTLTKSSGSEKKSIWTKRVVGLLVVLLAVALGFSLSRIFSPGGGLYGSKEEQPEALYRDVSGVPQIGQEAPDIAFKSYEGKNYRLSDLRGKVVLLNFWATWCPPCRQEMPSMDAAYKELKDKGLVIVAVSVDRDGKAAVAEFKQKMSFSFPVALDTEAKAARVYRVTSIPANFIIDRQGKIVNKVVGAVDWNSQQAKGSLVKLLD